MGGFLRLLQAWGHSGSKDSESKEEIEKEALLELIKGNLEARKMSACQYLTTRLSLNVTGYNWLSLYSTQPVTNVTIHRRSKLAKSQQFLSFKRLSES